MLNSTIKKLIDWLGLSQVQVAGEVELSPSQLSQYLQGNASANKDVLEKLLSIVGINYKVYSNRIKLAEDAAKALLKKNVTVDEVALLSKKEMVEKTSLKAIYGFNDVDRKGLNDIISSKVVDPADTYPYFQAMVIQTMNSMGKGSRKFKNPLVGSLVVSAAKEDSKKARASVGSRNHKKADEYSSLSAAIPSMLPFVGAAATIAPFVNAAIDGILKINKTKK